MIPPTILRSMAAFALIPASLLARSPDTRQRMKAYLDSVPAIDTHDHLGPFEKFPGYQQTKDGKVINLASIWRNSYLPLQIHTGHARIQGSNPMLLLDMIAANPETQFVLLHGGFPWWGKRG